MDKVSGFGWNFAAAVMPLPRQAWAFHHEFMLALTLLFAAASLLTLVALFRHRRSARGHSGPNLLWGVLPFAILLCLNLALFDPAGAFS